METASPRAMPGAMSPRGQHSVQRILWCSIEHCSPHRLIQCIATVDDGNNGIISALDLITIDNTTHLSNVTITPAQPSLTRF